MSKYIKISLELFKAVISFQAYTLDKIQIHIITIYFLINLYIIYYFIPSEQIDLINSFPFSQT